MRMQVRSLALLSGLRIQCCHELWCRSQTPLESGVAISCGVGCRCGWDPTLLWLWCRPAATASIGPLAWEPPYAARAAQENGKKTKKKKVISWGICLSLYDLYNSSRQRGIPSPLSEARDRTCILMDTSQICFC